ncbi:MAG: hypothetical protein AAFP84_22560 [Actinomycetota bacterium]
MTDRRILMVFAAVAIAAVGLLSLRSGSETSTADTTRSDREPIMVVRSSTVLAPAASTSAVPSTSRERADAPSIVGAESTTDVDGEEPTDILELLDAARPTVPADPIVDDGHPHARADTRPDEVTATSLIVAMWSWRFDDPADNTHVELRRLADADLIERRATTPAEIARRIEYGEVAWVIVRNVDTTGSTVTVRFDQHVVTSRNAETITTRIATVTIEDGIAVAVQVH